MYVVLSRDRIYSTDNSHLYELCMKMKSVLVRNKLEIDDKSKKRKGNWNAMKYQKRESQARPSQMKGKKKSWISLIIIIINTMYAAPLNLEFAQASPVPAFWNG